MTWNSQKFSFGRLLLLSPSNFILLYLLLILFLAGCGASPFSLSSDNEQDPVATETSTEYSQTVPTSRTTITPAPPATMTTINPPTLTSIPTTTPSPTSSPTNTPSPTSTWTPPPIGPCMNRIPSDDELLTLITPDFSLARDYVPGDLVPLSDYLPFHITLGYPTEVRSILIPPLVDMINDMEAAGLKPFIISGYRSYSAQAIAWDKWVDYNPDYAAGLSARPGRSEHQLGTTVDFGSPELEAVTGIEDIEFHTLFYLTSEGAWLIENAHKYGFTLSYPRDTLEITGFYYEPWHYRYVGVDLATQLKNENTYLIAFLLENFPPPCLGE